MASRPLQKWPQIAPLSLPLSEDRAKSANGLSPDTRSAGALVFGLPRL